MTSSSSLLTSMSLFLLWTHCILIPFARAAAQSNPKLISDNGSRSSASDWYSISASSGENVSRGSRVKRYGYEGPPKFDGDVFDPLRSSGLICGLCVVTDEAFVGHYAHGEDADMQNRIRKLVDSISWLWRSVDWNGDDFPDNVGFSILRFERWDPFPGEDAAHYETPRNAMSLLVELGRIDFSSCCLGLGFTMRPFVEHVGVSLVASPNLVGGICDFRRVSPNFSSRNVILVTGNGFRNVSLISTDLEQVLLHELGHAFGVTTHDNDFVRDGRTINRECSGHPPNLVRDLSYGPQHLLTTEPPSGRFIMWSNNEQGKRKFRWNNLQFSTCSKREVAVVLKMKRGICFAIEFEPFCGNGILEGNEVCDCGSEQNCRYMTCCGSKTSSYGCQKTYEAGNRPCLTKFSYPLTIITDYKQYQKDQLSQRQFEQQNQRNRDETRNAAGFSLSMSTNIIVSSIICISSSFPS